MYFKVGLSKKDPDERAIQLWGTARPDPSCRSGRAFLVEGPWRKVDRAPRETRPVLRQGAETEPPSAPGDRGRSDLDPSDPKRPDAEVAEATRKARPRISGAGPSESCADGRVETAVRSFAAPPAVVGEAAGTVRKVRPIRGQSPFITSA